MSSSSAAPVGEPQNPPNARPALAAILLSGGASARMGGKPKALCEVGGLTLLERLLNQLGQAGVSHAFVVTGAHDEILAPVIANLASRSSGSITRVHNAHWQEGPGTSLRAGLNASLAVSPAFDGLLVTPIDLPCTRTADWQLLLDCFLIARKTVAVAHGDECSPGAPVVFSPADAAAVRGLNDSGGAKEWLQAHLPRIHCLGCAPLTWDADTPAALKALGIVEPKA